MMNLVIDDRIPFIRGLFEPHAHVVYAPAAAIDRRLVRDADVLLVRTRTHCGADLLGGSRVRLIGSATIGTDHIDRQWCHRMGIAVRNAPGCNAPAVAQWVFSAIALWLGRQPGTWCDALTLGVIGVGHVGSIVARWGRQLGLKVLLNDPPRGIGVTLDELLGASDIITIHTPLTHDGPWPTRHLLAERQIAAMPHCRLLINAARGGIVDERAVLERFAGDLALDCWQGEPHIDSALVARAMVATPHIAGYSVEGKRRATAMVVEAVNRHCGWQVDTPQVDAPQDGAVSVDLEEILHSFDPSRLTGLLKDNPDDFELIRNNYALRREYASDL